MSTKVLYKQGSKATYLGLIERLPNALYFCTDTRELFRGNDLYTDGIRFVSNYDELPTYDKAADGKIYYCMDTGTGYVLNSDRDNWVCVITGVDGTTITVTESGLLKVGAVPLSSVVGLEGELKRIEEKIVSSALSPSNEFTVSQDGVLSIQAVEQRKIVGLEDRLANIEDSIVGGVRYRGSVETFENLPAGAQVGDLYEVRFDHTEWCWNGDEWFEYGGKAGMMADEVRENINALAMAKRYEIVNKPEGTLINYADEEIRIMCPSDYEWTHQNVGATGNKNMYYIGFRAYAPSEDVVSFKEDTAEIISDNTMYYFENNAFAGIDEYGRKYSLVWLAVASYDETSGTWKYFGDTSSTKKYIGWDYTVEWYNAAGVKVHADTIRINLSNENCHSTTMPYYMANIQNALEQMEESYLWGDM